VRDGLPNDVSARIAQQRLLPALAALDAGTVVLGDGYSCRLQMAQLAELRARHLAQLVDELTVPDRRQPPEPSTRPAPSTAG
jgi:Fe-S oxidoreductase